MKVGRAFLAHILSVYFASAALMTGLGAIEDGINGAIDFFARWVGGVLIFGILAIVTLPIGLALRWCAGRVFSKPERAALFVGVCVGLALIPVLHPAMMPPMSFSTHPFALFVVHGVSGLLAGLTWLLIEQPTSDLGAA